MCAWAKDQGLSVFDLLKEIYTKYGFYQESLVSMTRKGMKGAEEIKQMMIDLRANTPKLIGGIKVIKTMDYQMSLEKDVIAGTEKKIDLPKSDVLQFLLNDGTKISARPSGTEPKIKFYISVNAAMSSADEYYNTKLGLEAKIEVIKKDLGI
jgi:phosphoglucomutase